MLDRVREDRFTQIYRDHAWSGRSRSGPGSDPENASMYLGILQRLLGEQTFRIRAVLDIGCGDWSLGMEICWDGIQYVGMDIVPELIDTLNAKYSSRNVKFLQGDLANDEIPPADLVIVKDVLQHLSNRSVQTFLRKLPRFRFALITNDARRRRRMPWPLRFLKQNMVRANCDIQDGGSRPLQLLRAPFGLSGRQLATYNLEIGNAIYTKQILLWKNPHVSPH